MHISKVSLVNYRNFSNAMFVFGKGVNTIIGENGSGKTNLFRAVRLLLDESMRRYASRLTEKDFNRSLLDWRGHWIVISIEFQEITKDEAIQALFLHSTGELEIVERATYNLIFRPNSVIRDELSKLNHGDTKGLNSLLNKVSIDDYETILTGKSNADFNDKDTYKNIVGDFENVIFPDEIDSSEIGAKVPQLLYMPRELSFTFIQALRDVVSEFHGSRNNPLFSLLQEKSGDIDEVKFQPIVDQVDQLNSAIEAYEDVVEIRDDIDSTINDTVGDTYSPNSLSIKSDLSNEAEQLFQSLKLFVSESDDGYEGNVSEMSLGGANMIYLVLKLLQFKYLKNRQTIANFLLIEEPEAHIHTHIQKTLFENVQFDSTQIIYSTHSPQISEASNVEQVNIIGKVKNSYEAFQPTTGLEPNQINKIQRYLDAIRSNLLFAKSVVLVEGDAEAIIIPALFKSVLGISLDELGISLINIGSTGFENVAQLFHDDRIRKRCSIITDLDSIFFDTTPSKDDSKALKKKKRKAIGSEKSGSLRKTSLDTFCNSNQWLSVHYAKHTLEVDLISTGNSNSFIKILNEVYQKQSTITTAKKDLLSNTLSESGFRAMTMATQQGKGWFAILLANAFNEESMIPTYILEAIFKASPPDNRKLVYRMMSFRFEYLIDRYKLRSTQVTSAKGKPQEWYDTRKTWLKSEKIRIGNVNDGINEHKEGNLNMSQLEDIFATQFPKDPFSSVLKTI